MNLFVNNFFINFVSLFFVSVLVVFLCSSSNIIIFLLILEWNGLLVVLLLFVGLSFSVSESVFIYYILNTLVFILFLWGVVLSLEELIILSFFLKLGFFPFIWWFPFLSDSLNFYLIFIFSVIQKLFPLLLVYWNSCIVLEGVLLAVIINVVISLINLVYNQNNIKVFLAWSSNINYSWILYIFFKSWAYGVSYYIFYVISFTFFIYFISSYNEFWDQICVTNWLGLLVCLLTFCSFSGFPPFIGFYYKLIFFSTVDGKVLSMGLSNLVYSGVCSVFFVWNAFIYINMVFKLNVNKWFFGLVDYSYYGICFIVWYILFSFYVLYI
nr:NADH dehydrogenase subunit 2 [Parakontikia ventrolineata]